jgi:DNA-binding SARP family transcriptional activator
VLPVVQIRLFDTVGISVDGAPVSLPYKQAEFVLAYLILSQPDPVDKDLLAELLWPGKSPGIGRRNLRHALHTLRTRLGLEESILSTKSQSGSSPTDKWNAIIASCGKLFREQDIDARTSGKT